MRYVSCYIDKYRKGVESIETVEILNTYAEHPVGFQFMRPAAGRGNLPYGACDNNI